MEALAAEIATLREQAEIKKSAHEELQEQVKKLQEEMANKGKQCSKEEEDKRVKLAAATSEIIAAVLKINHVYDPLNNPE
jgi:molybdopterin converting factor small subunit